MDSRHSEPQGPQTPQEICGPLGYDPQANLDTDHDLGYGKQENDELSLILGVEQPAEPGWSSWHPLWGSAALPPAQHTQALRENSYLQLTEPSPVGRRGLIEDDERLLVIDDGGIVLAVIPTAENWQPPAVGDRYLPEDWWHGAEDCGQLEHWQGHHEIDGTIYEVDNKAVVISATKILGRLNVIEDPGALDELASTIGDFQPPVGEDVDWNPPADEKPAIETAPQPAREAQPPVAVSWVEQHVAELLSGEQLAELDRDQSRQQQQLIVEAATSRHQDTERMHAPAASTPAPVKALAWIGAAVVIAPAALELLIKAAASGHLAALGLLTAVIWQLKERRQDHRLSRRISQAFQR